MTRAENTQTPFSPRLRVLTESQIKQIHSATMEILDKTGVEVYDDEALGLLRNAGCTIEGSRVRISEELVNKALESVPGPVTIYDRLGNPAMRLADYNSYFGTGSDCPNTLDLETGERRLGVLNDVARSSRLVDALDNLDFVMSYALPSDVPGSISYLTQFREMVSNTTKPMVYVCDGLDDIKAIISMAETVVGGAEALRQKPFLALYGEPTTPLRHSVTALQKVLFLAEKELPVIYSPGIGAGGQTPITAAGSLAVGNAEILSGLVIHQLKNAGAPFIYGGGFSILDMATAVVSYSAPEFVMRNAAMTEMARSYGLPTFSFAGSADSKRLDIQAGVEIGMFSLISALSGANLLHDVGYLESGLTGSLELVVIGDEVAGMVRRFVSGINVNKEKLAVDVVDKVGPGGWFLDQDHTMDHFRDELWFPSLFTRERFEQWEESGSKTALDKARDKARRLLKSHTPTPLADGVLEQLNAIIDEALTARTKTYRGAQA